MAIPKGNPAELESRLLEAGNMLRQAGSALKEVSAYPSSHELRATLTLVSSTLASTAERVLS